jgi:nucleoside-diphosphate-sugar epimerase
VQVVVIGGAGYLGSVLCRALLARGHRVRVLDALLYGAASLEALLREPRFSLVAGDTRDPLALADAVGGAYAAVHLGELVGDPACAANEALAHHINGDGTRRVIAAARRAGLGRLVFASSCSVYGGQAAGLVDESAVPAPCSLQAKLKHAAERALLEEHEGSVAPVVLRLASLFGLSPRPRFDLTVNQLAARAALGRRVDLLGGSVRRPFLHVRDAARAIAAVVEAPSDRVGGRIFNLGSDAGLASAIELGEIIARVVPEARRVRRECAADTNGARVSFGRFARTFDFLPRYDLEDGVGEIVAAVRAGRVCDPTAPRFHNHDALAAPAVQRRLRHPGPAAEPEARAVS